MIPSREKALAKGSMGMCRAVALYNEDNSTVDDTTQGGRLHNGCIIRMRSGRCREGTAHGTMAGRGPKITTVVM